VCERGGNTRGHAGEGVESWEAGGCGCAIGEMGGVSRGEVVMWRFEGGRMCVCVCVGGVDADSSHVARNDSAFSSVRGVYPRPPPCRPLATLTETDSAGRLTLDGVGVGGCNAVGVVMWGELPRLPGGAWFGVLGACFRGVGTSWKASTNRGLCESGREGEGVRARMSKCASKRR